MFGITVYDSERTLYVWNAGSNRITAKLTGHLEPVRFERNGSLLVANETGHRDGPFSLLDTASGRQLAKVQKSPVVSPDDQYVAGVPDGNTASVWIWRVRRMLW
jgi:WD40 repeat protein